MDLLEALLGPETMAGILIIGAFAMAIRSVLHFTREAADMRPRLAELDRELKRRREGSEEARRQLAEVLAELAPVRAREAAMRAYQEQLLAARVDHERLELERSEDDQASKRKRIQRKKIGLPGD
jgi:hypothetical protein